MFKQNDAHIVYASDDKFSEILGVSLVSLYENSKDMEQINVYVLNSGISSQNMEKLLSISRKYHRNDIKFISARDISKVLSMDVNADRGSLSQYARLFVSSDLPADLERVLYLDCDIIINKSIATLWQLDMHGKTIAALKDAFSSHYRKNIELQKDDVMFNSGVMLIDLTRWRELEIEKRLMEFIRKKNGVIQQGDQGALNAVLSKDTYCFHPKFNSVTIFYDFTYDEMLKYRKPVDFYRAEEVQESVEDPYIIHFTTSFMSVRPWIEGCSHKYCNRWLEYKSISPWSENKLWENKPAGTIKSMYMAIMKKCPRSLMIAVSSILQVYGRPLVYAIKKR